MMASKQTYPCFQCEKNGFPDVRVYLDGKDANGKTIYKNEDLSPHTHKQGQYQQQTVVQQSQTPVQQASTIISDLQLQMKLLHQKLDRVLEYIDKERS